MIDNTYIIELINGTKLEYVASKYEKLLNVVSVLNTSGGIIIEDVWYFTHNMKSIRKKDSKEIF